MTLETFYLICFIAGFLFSVLSFLSVTRRPQIPINVAENVRRKAGREPPMAKQLSTAAMDQAQRRDKARSPV